MTPERARDRSFEVFLDGQVEMYRDSGIALTKRGEGRPEAKEFAAFLDKGRSRNLRQMGLARSQ